MGEGRCASSRAWVREGERGERGFPEASRGSPVEASGVTDGRNGCGYLFQTARHWATMQIFRERRYF